MTQVKAKIEQLFKAKFIYMTKYITWLSHIVLVIRKNGKLCVCIDFRHLNNIMTKDEYSISMVNMLVDSTVGNTILSFMDEHSGYNQIFIAEDDISKIVFRCPKSLGM